MTIEQRKVNLRKIGWRFTKNDDGYNAARFFVNDIERNSWGLGKGDSEADWDDSLTYLEDISEWAVEKYVGKSATQSVARSA